MNFLKPGLVGLVAMSFVVGASANDGNPIDMVHEVGFTGCDASVLAVFETALKAKEGRFQISYFNETAKSSVDLQVAFGSVGDTVFKTAHFEKSGDYCYAMVRTVVPEDGNCAGVLSKDPNFKYTNDSAGALWARNKGGVDKLLIQAGNFCNQIYLSDDKRRVQR